MSIPTNVVMVVINVNRCHGHTSYDLTDKYGQNLIKGVPGDQVYAVDYVLQDEPETISGSDADYDRAMRGI